ncbi:MAG: hypothetical protein WCT19_00310 [Candidatus Paceibacterota bacterium]|jgi:hypothetical protein
MNLIQKSGQMGSIPGGWYEDKDTGAEYYVKFYKYESTAKGEFLANEFYKKLNIYVPEKSLIVFEDRPAITSKKVGDGVRATFDEQVGHPDLVKGFAADAFLNNWDVVGEFFDNVIKDDNSHLYRVDNGGTGPIRANEGRKNFSKDSIPEIDDMRNPKFQAGMIFKDVSEKQIMEQSAQLLNVLTNEYITETISGLKFEPELEKVLIEGYLGRKAFLASKYVKMKK